MIDVAIRRIVDGTEIVLLETQVHEVPRLGDTLILNRNFIDEVDETLYVVLNVEWLVPGGATVTVSPVYKPPQAA